MRATESDTTGPRRREADGARPGAASLSTGWLAVAVGLAVNKWTLEPLVAADERLSSPLFLVPIALFQLVCIAAGIRWITGPPRRVSPMTGVATVAAVAALALAGYGLLRATRIVDPHRALRAAWADVTDTEDLTLALADDLRLLTESVSNLELPDHRSRPLFADDVVVTSAARGAPTAATGTGAVALRQVGWDLPAGGPAPVVWPTLLDAVDYFAHAKFDIVRGRFPGAARDRFEADVMFAGLARMRGGEWQAIDADIQVAWRRTGRAASVVDDGWRIVAWHTARFDATATDALWFDEVTAAAIADGGDLARARRSIHEEKIVARLRDPKAGQFQPTHFSDEAMGIHPSVSVVDVDRDGLDDLYVMARWGENMLFRNAGDGTFVETAAALGLDVADHTTSAIFADFDNDGDDDVFLGRSIAPSRYLVNENGRYVDRTAELVDGPIPQLVSAVAAVDYDGDGLLDLYVSTYGAGLVQPGDGGRLTFIDGYVPERDRATVVDLINRDDAHLIMNSYGPPNVLLRNAGDGRFTVVAEPAALRVFRNTLQATWADYDDDGDPDVYVANDFAPNNLFRNDGAGVFVDVTADTATADQGYGMGAAWGDYDRDGRQDLYVSNMFSKAGRRILAHFPQVDERFPRMARGNTLFRNRPGRFDHVSGLEPPALQVEKAGWSWGGQFVDVDNDGYLDIYALSGFYTAPREFEVPFDG